MQSSSTPRLKLTVSSAKTNYQLGEKIDLAFELKNTNKETMTFLDIFGTGSGFLNLTISQSGAPFEKFSHPRWGTVDINGAETSLKSNEASKTSAALLWDWAKQDVPRFTFSNSGVYQIKATYNLLTETKESVLLESQPIQITIEEPVGEDSEVWNRIKDNGDFAYFIQEGDFRIPSYKTEERAKFQKEVEQIISQYPNSLISKQLEQSLKRFRENEEKRVNSLRKIQKEKQQ